MVDDKHFRTLAEKLYPLMPDVIRDIERKRSLPDQEIRIRMARKLLTLADEHLGHDHSYTPLLSLPPQSTIAGDINLGTVLYERGNPKWPAGISKSELKEHMTIYGRSGSGKSNTAYHVMLQLLNQNVPFTFLDYKGIGRNLINCTNKKLNFYTPGSALSPLPFNVLSVPPGMSPEFHIGELLDILDHAFTLGDGSMSVLQNAIMSCYDSGLTSPSVEDVITRVESADNAGRAGQWKVSALRALSQLQFSGISSSDHVKQDEQIQALLNQNAIIDLTHIANKARSVLVSLLSMWMYYVRRREGSTRSLKNVIIVDEGQHVFYATKATQPPLMDRLLREVREFGIGFIILNQEPASTSKAARSNTFATLSLDLKEPSDVRAAASSLLLGDEEKKYLQTLPTGHAICRLQKRWMKPFLLHIPHIKNAEQSVSDSAFQAYINNAISDSRKINKTSERIPLNPSNSDDQDHVFQSNDAISSTDSSSIAPLSLNSGGFPRIGVANTSLSDAAIFLLSDVVEFPDSGVVERNARLGLSARRAHTLKSQLINTGWLISKIVELGKTRKVLLGLSSEAREFLGVESNAKQLRGGLAHQYFQRLYHHFLLQRGYDAACEIPVSGGFVDVAGKKKRAKSGMSEAEFVKLAIQVESGKSRIVRNVQIALASGYHKVLTVAMTKQAFSTCQRLLSDAGLLTPNRVRVALRDQIPDNWIP